MRKSKFLKLRKLISRINDPRLKELDRLREIAQSATEDMLELQKSFVVFSKVVSKMFGRP